jgi:hypothetical protein
MGLSRTFLPGNSNNEADHGVHETGTFAEPVHIAAGTVWNVGRARLTTVMTRIAMMAPITTTPAILSTAEPMWFGRSGGSTLLRTTRLPLAPRIPSSPSTALFQRWMADQAVDVT